MSLGIIAMCLLSDKNDRRGKVICLFVFFSFTTVHMLRVGGYSSGGRTAS